ncbi:MAG: hypothetical protein ACRDBG_01830 [Waterburya sp.]
MTYLTTLKYLKKASEIYGYCVISENYGTYIKLNKKSAIEAFVASGQNLENIKISVDEDKIDRKTTVYLG